MNNFFTILFFAIFSTISLSSQNVESLVKRISEDGYTSKYVGDGDIVTPQWLRYDTLRQITNEDQLISLTDHSCASVKCYSFKALVEINSTSVFRILINHLEDVHSLSTFIGCIIGDTKVNSFMMNELSGYRHNLTKDLKNELLEDSILENDLDYDFGLKYFENLADSVLLYDSLVHKNSLASLIRRIKPKPHYYDRIKEVKSKIDTRDYIVILSKFQKQEDRDIIIRHLESKNVHDQNAGLTAIKFFPDEAFFVYLEKLHEKFIKQTPKRINLKLLIYYEAIAQYKNVPAYNLFRNTLYFSKKNAIKSQSKHIWIALKNYPEPIFGIIKKNLDLTKKEIEEIENTIVFRSW